MGKVVLDTSSWIDLERQQFNPDHLEGTEVVIMAAAALAELRFALEARAQTEAARLKTKDFIQAALGVSVFEPIDEKTAEIFSQLKAFCKTAGAPRGINNLWIAATAIRHDAVLISSDRKALFSDLPNLKFQG